MEDDETVGVAAPGRTWSLRREWSRAFIILLALLLVAGVATFTGVRAIVGQFSGTAQQLDRETTSVASLQAAIDAHETIGHQLINGAPLDTGTFLAQQDDIVRRFDETRQVLRSSGASTAALDQARTTWQEVMTNAGLWSSQLPAFAPSTGTKNQVAQAALGDNSGGVRGLLSGLQKPALDAMHKGLANDARLEHLLMAVLGGLFALALAVTVYFRRRMAVDLVRPVASLHEGVMKLRSGEYDHRIAVARRDELGELAEAFNGMAGALYDSHLALTLRATHDSLTGLPNRASLTDRLTASFSPHPDRRARQESVLFIDIDDFKYVNDSLGHEGGDALLIQLAGRLIECVRPGDLVARLGGDEFAVVVVESGSYAVGVVERILEAMRQPFVVDDQHLVVAASIGVAHRQPDTSDAAELLRQADFAMYMAKGGGKNRYQLFDAQMHNAMLGRAGLKSDLANAVGSDQLRLEYQPVADLRTGEIVGVEALVRWQHPTLGVLMPAEFITLAEETGDIHAVGAWVLDAATRQAAGWRRTMEHCADLWLSVNVSSFQLADVDSLAAIGAILTDPAAQADKVVLEITETALAADVDGAIAALYDLKRLGARVAIDDFGTGFSSLSTLASVPADILKIDRSFVSGQASTSPSVPMLEGILGLAGKLDLDVIAEGIEESGQLELLRTLGCEVGQGYLLGRPVDAGAFEAVLASGGLLHVIEQPERGARPLK